MTWVKEVSTLAEGHTSINIKNELGSANYTERSLKKQKPAIRLFQAILTYAIIDYIAGLKNPYQNEDYRTAKNWLFNDSYSPFPSFDVVCEILNLDKAPLRRAIIQIANSKGYQSAEHLQHQY